MNRCAMQQSAFAAWEEVMRGPLAGSDRKNSPVCCPKPRRFGPVHAADPVHPVRPVRLYTKYQPEIYDSRPGVELLDIYTGEEQDHVASSPPFFCGSPPSRASNPLVNDPRFGEVEAAVQVPAQAGSKNRTALGCGRVESRFEPAAVRIEGFDCLDRRVDSRARGHAHGPGIAAVA